MFSRCIYEYRLQRVNLPSVNEITSHGEGSQTFNSNHSLRTTIVRERRFYFVDVFVSNSFQRSACKGTKFRVIYDLGSHFRALLSVLSIRGRAMRVTRPIKRRQVVLRFLLNGVTNTSQATTMNRRSIRVTSIIYCVRGDLVL